MYVSDCIQIIILGLAIGGIPFGVLLAKLFKLPDPRYVGSGNIGATNMLRTGNKKVALLTLLLDAAKGWVVVFVTTYLFVVFDVARAATDSCGTEPTLENCSVANPNLAALAVLAAAIGHMYSPYLKFKGGKGVATLFGGALAFSWPVAMASLFVWLIAVFLTRYVSLGSILALAAAPLVAWLRVDGTSAFILAIAAGIAIWKHRENIKRLRQGFESKLSFGKGDKP
jgi:glycerol-3-phosphate acyltransferase PlsY